MFTISSLISENKYNNHLIQNFVYGEDYNTFNENINPINLDVTEIDDFTLLIYMIGSDLEDKSYEATKDINEMLKTNLFNPKVNVVLETGGSTGKPDKNNNRTIDFSKVQRHQIVDGNIKTISDLGKVNMGENKTLSDFLNWGVTKYPAKKYGLILWDHGGSYGGFGNDINFANDALTMNELDYGLRLPKLSYPSIDNVTSSVEIDFEFIGFDSCLMASLEVARSVYNNNTTTDNPSSISNDLHKIKFKFLIASEEIEPVSYTHLTLPTIYSV